jgi:hypothetical protein
MYTAKLSIFVLQSDPNFNAVVIIAIAQAFKTFQKSAMGWSRDVILSCFGYFCKAQRWEKLKA